MSQWIAADPNYGPCRRYHQGLNALQYLDVTGGAAGTGGTASRIGGLLTGIMTRGGTTI
jgi:hypothetical protein